MFPLGYHYFFFCKPYKHSNHAQFKKIVATVTIVPTKNYIHRHYMIYELFLAFLINLDHFIMKSEDQPVNFKLIKAKQRPKGEFS